MSILSKLRKYHEGATRSTLRYFVWSDGSITMGKSPNRPSKQVRPPVGKAVHCSCMPNGRSSRGYLSTFDLPNALEARREIFRLGSTHPRNTIGK